MKIENANQKPSRWYGLHFTPGCAEYREAGKDPYRIFVNETAIKQMDRTFEGCPVYVKHVDEVDFKKLEQEAAGIVVKSFWNSIDGKTWVEFIIFSDEGHEAIKKGWRLSNAYVPTEWGGSGTWNGIDYQRQVLNGKYEHLALVPNPRYDESIILSPDEFKSYNEKKDIELKKLANSKQGDESVLHFFKRTKVENSSDFEHTLVTLPKSKLEKSIAQLVEEMDAIHNMQGYANPDHMVKVNDQEEMTVKDLMNKYSSMVEEKKNAEEEAKKASEVGDDASKKNEEKAEEKKEEEPKKNEEKVEEKKKEEKKQNSDDDKAVKKAMNEKIKEAEKMANGGVHQPVISLDKTSMGRLKYGSSK